jgi:tetratricopeptide (TPR) repeat protein
MSESPPFTTSTPATTLVAPVKAEPEKRSFLSRLNPFRSSRKPDSKAVEVASAGQPANASNPAIGEETAESFPRYRYQRPAAPTPGNRTEAEAALARGREAEGGVNSSQAIQAYRQATQIDPAYFEAQYHLALAQYTLRDSAAALVGWETALAIRPDSTEARYNFALTLKSAGYALDAVVELERILATSPDDVRAHLILGNLYAEQLRDKSRARVHYQRILELDARHPQATAIRYWLVANPG